MRTKSIIGQQLLSLKRCAILLQLDTTTKFHSEITCSNQYKKVNSLKKKQLEQIAPDIRLLQNYFTNIYNNQNKALNIQIARNIIIASSPGFLGKQYIDYITKKYQEQYGVIKAKEYINKIKYIEVSDPQNLTVNEILKDKRLLDLLQDKKFVQEIKAVTEFFTTLEMQPDKVCYGYKDVKNAIECNAVQTLLIVDTLTRNNDNNIRSIYESLYNEAKLSNIIAYEISGSSDIGKQLNDMTGIVAILRFSIKYLDDDFIESQDTVVYDNSDNIS